MCRGGGDVGVGGRMLKVLSSEAEKKIVTSVHLLLAFFLVPSHINAHWEQ